MQWMPRWCVLQPRRHDGEIDETTPATSRYREFSYDAGDRLYCVDTTPLVRRLVEEGFQYDLSRPSRFGKNLLLDTFRSLFEVCEELFRGMDIRGLWDWSIHNPALWLDFGGEYPDADDLERSIQMQIDAARSADLPPSSQTNVFWRVRDFLARLHRATGRRVDVLDNCDDPVFSYLYWPDRTAKTQDYLNGLHSFIKGRAAHIRFMFCTGTGPCLRGGVFASIHNLLDSGFDRRYATICGYTQAEIEEVFAPEVAGLGRKDVKERYLGYRWRSGERVNSPEDVLSLLQRGGFRPWWFESDSHFRILLYRTLTEQCISLMEFENHLVGESSLSCFEDGYIGTESLLFHIGYLTIAEERNDGFHTHRLNYLDLEVGQRLCREMLTYLRAAGKIPADGRRDTITTLFSNSRICSRALLSAALRVCDADLQTTSPLTSVVVPRPVANP